MYGLVITRSRPPAPASRSIARPNASGRARNRPPTVTAGTVDMRSLVGRDSGVRIDQPEVTVLAAVEHLHRVAPRVAEHQERVLAAIELQRRFVGGHRLDRITCAAPDPAHRRIAVAVAGH